MSGNIFEELLKRVPQKIKNYNRLSMGIAAAIDDKLKSEGMTQKVLAEKLEKKESEISKWLSGKHNFTIKSIANIEAALGVELVSVNYLPKSKQKVSTSVFSKNNESIRYVLIVAPNNASDYQSGNANTRLLPKNIVSTCANERKEMQYA